METLKVVLYILWFLASLFLILLILIQRGRGGGLAGAFGAAGGSSAFGTRTGDVFTKITVGVFAFWIFCAMGLVPLSKETQAYSGGSKANLPKDDQIKQDPNAEDALKSLEKPAPILPADGKTDGKKDAPKADAKQDAPKADAPKTDAAKKDAPKSEAPKTEAEKKEPPKTDAAKSPAKPEPGKSK